ncbi:MAG: diadenylate cyclase [Calditrichia bacterium]
MTKKDKTEIPYTPPLFSINLDKICNEERHVNPAVLRSVIELAIEISREGREGRKIGTMFVVGDEKVVLATSRALILDPLAGHPDNVKHIEDPSVRETVKELAQLDGAFIVSNDGVVVSAARYIDVNSKGIKLPLGLGSRHLAAAGITRDTGAVAVVVSESSVVRILDDGVLIAQIIPELWLIHRSEELP